jgi:cbb3-type cytochrome oxidase cytochrome c subunit
MADKLWSPTRGYFTIGEGGAARKGARGAAPAAAAAESAAAGDAAEAAEAAPEAEGGAAASGAPARGAKLFAPARGFFAVGAKGAKGAPARAGSAPAPAAGKKAPPPAAKAGEKAAAKAGEKAAAKAAPGAAETKSAARPAAAKPAASRAEAPSAPGPAASDPARESVTTVPGLTESEWGKVAAAALYTEPDSESTLYRVPAMNVLFAVSSALLLVYLVLVLWQDYWRHWKVIQADWNRELVERHEKELAEAASERNTQLAGHETELAAILTSLLGPERGAAVVEEARLATAAGPDGAPARVERYLGSARRSLEGNERYQELHDAHVRAKTQHLFAEGRLRDFRGKYQAEKFRFEEEKAHILETLGDTPQGLEKVAALGAEFKEEYDRRLEEIDAEVERLKGAEEAAAADLVKHLKATASGTDGRTLLQLDEAVAAISRKTTEISGRITHLESNWRNALRNAPLLDFLAPTYTIRKQVIGDLFEDLNFLQVPRIDRCETCHINITETDPSFAGYESEKWGSVYASHPRLDLFVGSSSPHPYLEFGCTTCHYGDGHSTDFTTATHTPRDEAQAEEWREKFGWKKLKYQDFPMVPMQHITSSCRKCHTDEEYVEGGGRYNEGYRLVKTYGCFGCHKIKDLEGEEKVGPNLLHIADKAEVGFLYKWIRNPRHFRESTRMPRFFDLTNSSGSMLIQGAGGELHSTDFETRNGVEALALATYLAETSWRRALPDVGEGDPARGRNLVLQTGCLGCHSIQRESITGGGEAPGNGGAPAIESLVGEALAALGAFAAAREAEAATAKGDTAKNDTAKDDTRPALEQAAAAARRAAGGLSRLKGFFDRLPVGRTAAELYHAASAPLDELEKLGAEPPVVAAARAAADAIHDRWIHETFAPDLSAIGSKVRDPRWLADWILDPRRHDPATVMPRFRFETEADGRAQVADIVAYLMSLRDPEFDGAATFALDSPEAQRALDDLFFDHKKRDVTRQEAAAALASLSARDKLVFVGHRLIRRYGCFGCHDGIRDVFSETPGKLFDEAQQIGTELNGWGIKDLKQLDFGHWGHQHNGDYAIPPTRHDWAAAKLRDTRRFDVLPAERRDAHGRVEYEGTRRLLQKTPEELLKMPLFGFADDAEQVDAVVTFLLGLDKDRIPLSKAHRLSEEETALEAGRRLIASLNCKGCHRIGAETRYLHVSLLPRFSFYDEGREVERQKIAEVETWLAEPLLLRAREEILPAAEEKKDFDLKKAGVSLPAGTYLSKPVWDASTMDAGKGDEAVSVVELAMRDFERRKVPEAEWLLSVGGFEEGSLRAYLGAPADQRFKAPPPLQRQGERTRADWLFRFLTDVQPIRPNLKVRMPSFHLSQDQARTLVRWFRVKWGLPHGEETFEADVHSPDLARLGREAFQPNQLSCNSCHPSGNVLPSQPQLDPANAFEWSQFPFEIGDDGHYVVWMTADGKFERQTGFPAAPAAREWGEEKFRGTRTRWAVGQPWDKSSWGPDLAKASARLRPTWMFDWLRNPRSFYPETKMPNFFGDDGDPIAGHPLDDDDPAQAAANKEKLRKMHGLVQYLIHMRMVDAEVAAAKNE